eukprot:CAMPEP_0114238200 /NCGR_PEP_ID=MMETSP0058-20121206/7798_1 /TAXON_ID=36894 /ORGANISM="Pyramimonas parkeae, CCMP726" /LENGTH=453 /DNA_ID=CAMNT_0001350295 /DNA_START=226 /DNA_END=1587 /DNA_ORIENTATION=-
MLLPLPSSAPTAKETLATDPWKTVFATAGAEAINAAILMLAYVLSGSASVPLIHALSGSSVGGASAIGMDALFGAVLGLVHCSKPLMSGDYVASFPLVQRHRVIRMKHRLPEAMCTAAWASSVAALCFAGLSCQPYFALSPSSTLTLRHHLCNLAVGGLVSFCWAASFHVLEVLLTEHHMFLSTDSGATSEMHCRTLITAMSASNDPLVQHLAYQDMCHVAQQTPHTAWRRKAVFESPSGQAWTELVTLCAIPVNALVVAMLPVVTPLAQAPTGSVLEALSKASPKQACVAAATWHLRKNFQICSWGITGLGSLAAAARKEDVYGVMQLQEPTLGTITSALLSCLLCLRICMNAAIDPALTPAGTVFKWVSSNVGMPQGNPVGMTRRYYPAPNLLHSLHKPCVSLADLVQTALYKLVAVYGDELTTSINGRTPAFGEAKEHASLLKSMLDFSG